jgi:hypothetical protein
MDNELQREQAFVSCLFLPWVDCRESFIDLAAGDANSFGIATHSA